MCRALGVTKKLWSTYAKEMLAIVEAIRAWRPYLLGRKFYVQTDHRSLKYLMEQRIMTLEQQKWISKLVGYDYEITYKPRKENSAVDSLSRVIGSPSLDALFVLETSLWNAIKKEVVEHPYMVRIGELASKNPGAPYKWQNELLLYKNRVVIPPNSHIISMLLHEFHDSPYGGHSGVLRTYKRIAQQFYWPSMHKVIKQYVASCIVCQKNKTDTLSPAGLLQPLPIPCHVWEEITMDFIEGLPPSNGKSTIFVIVERLTKSAHFLTLSHPYTAKMVAEKFVEGVVKLHGMPKSIVSDRDPIFINGQSEVVNRCVEQYLHCFVSQQPHKWSSYLPWAEFWYNTTYHSSIGMTPFQALYGRLPPSIPTYQIGASSVNEVDQAMITRDDVLKQLKDNLHVANNRMKQVADSKRRDVEFQVGDLVFLRLRAYRHQSVYWRTIQKLASRFYGPYYIEARIGKVAYRLKLPEGSKIHPVFHVSMLKRKVGDATVTSAELPSVAEDGEISVVPEALLDTRWVKKGSKFVEESLVQWRGLQDVTFKSK
ncbi:transposon ty3-I gag-pol polyprotein [Tanacetum coccineum]